MFKIKYHGGKDMTYKKAAVLAKEEANVIRQEATVEKEGGHGVVDTKEYVA